MTKIKICGLSRPADIEAVNAAHPDYIGFVLAPSRRQVTSQQARDLKAMLAPGILAVGVFVNAELQTIVPLVEDGVVDLVQLHGQEDLDYLARLRAVCAAPLIKAVAPGCPLRPKQFAAAGVQYLLFDGPQAGSGQTHNWQALPQSPLPFFLAGGLSANNVQQAITAVQPFGLDLSSGVETNGYKDPLKIEQVVRRVRNGQQR